MNTLICQGCGARQLTNAYGPQPCSECGDQALPAYFIAGRSTALETAERALLEWAADQGLSREQAIQSLRDEIAAGRLGSDVYVGEGFDAVPPYRYQDLIDHMTQRAALPTCPVNDNDEAAARGVGPVVIAGAVLGAVLFFGASVLASDGMAACQRLHGFDTCFSTLNR